MSDFKNKLKSAILNRENPSIYFKDLTKKCKKKLLKAAVKGRTKITIRIPVIYGRGFNQFLESYDLDYTCNHVNVESEMFPERLIYFIELPKYN